MTVTVTGSYESSKQTQIVFDDLMANGIPREQVFIDESSNEVKVMIADATEPDVEEMLRGHDAHSLTVNRV